MTTIVDPDEFTAYALKAFAQRENITSIVAGGLTANRKLLIASNAPIDIPGTTDRVYAMVIACLSESEARDYAAKILAPFDERSEK